MTKILAGMIITCTLTLSAGYANAGDGQPDWNKRLFMAEDLKDALRHARVCGRKISTENLKAYISQNNLANPELMSIIKDGFSELEDGFSKSECESFISMIEMQGLL